MPLGLLALAIGGFGIGLTEFVIMGLLPEVAADFQVSEPWPASSSPATPSPSPSGRSLITAAVTRFDRKRVLPALMVLFIGGNLLSALAPTTRS